ncbi:MAG: nucleotidyl transferase AbiEii/AbiGii toxin family protein [Vicinamibacterales bacterium]
MDDTDATADARAPEPEDLVRICRALNEAEARYVLIGGFAVIAHGASRFTKDIDLLVDDAPENIARVKRGLAILADNAAAEVADHDVRDHTVVRVVDEVIVDLMGRACGLTYADVAADMEWLELSGVRVPIASPSALVRTKDTYRPQDAIDRAFLEQVLDRRRREDSST